MSAPDFGASVALSQAYADGQAARDAEVERLLWLLCRVVTHGRHFMFDRIMDELEAHGYDEAKINETSRKASEEVPR